MKFRIWDPDNTDENGADTIESFGWSHQEAACKYANDIDFCEEPFESKDYLVRALDATANRYLYKVRVNVAYNPTFTAETPELAEEE